MTRENRGGQPGHNEPGTLVIYDGDCFFCSNYVQFLQLKKTIGPVELIDARSQDERVARYWQDGLDLNDGMVFVHRGEIFHGADAIHALALLSTSSNAFNAFNHVLLSNKTLAKMIYPILRFGRNMTLKIRGREQMQPR